MESLESCLNKVMPEVLNHISMLQPSSIQNLEALTALTWQNEKLFINMIVADNHLNVYFRLASELEGKSYHLDIPRADSIPQLLALVGGSWV